MRILITAGPTREYFDTVRYISNPSSGRMGYALARQAKRLHHDVVLISGPVGLPAPRGIRLLRVTSAAEMFDASVTAFAACDAAILTAAVCDYRPARRLDHKLKKRAQPRHITLVPTQDIAAHLGAAKEHRVVIGFAMEDHDHHAHAQAKLRRKRCDAVVLNTIENVGAGHATVEILLADAGWQPPMSDSKDNVAAAVIRLAARLAECRRPQGP